ncbi:MAG TPA: PDZ domain-containing protein, partial [Bellilinea sp.]|nr:PDZ domain-containing protein [Bellilinea sp.]
VRGGDVNPSLVEAMNLPIATGAYLVEVTPGGPAEQAGIRGADKQKLVNGRAVEVGGDLVIAIDGKSIDTFNDLLVYIALETRPGQTVTLTIVRNGKESDIDLLIGSRPETVE